MPTRNVVLSEHQHALVETLVQSGRYQNASEVLREGLRLIEQRESMDAAKRTALQAAAHQGWSDIAAGRYIELSASELEGFMAALGQKAVTRANTKG